MQIRGAASFGRFLVLVGVVLGLALTSQAVRPQPVLAATTLAVSTTTDVSTGTGAYGNSDITTPPSPLRLREATCLANNIGGVVTSNVPTGTFGELQIGKVTGNNVTISGAG